MTEILLKLYPPINALSLNNHHQASSTENDKHVVDCKQIYDDKIVIRIMTAMMNS